MNPYQGLPNSAFWRTAVADISMFDIAGLWDPKFDIKPSHKVVTYGSCFAQRIGVALQERGFGWLCTEKAPEWLDPAIVSQYEYNIFSSRTGNIYTTSLLKQWCEWAFNGVEVPDEYWEKDGRIYDPFRPRIEPNGFESVEEMRNSRNQTIKSFRESVTSANFFVFTLGLTESWFNAKGYEYPMCPGTVAGEFDPEAHKFVNQPFNAIIKNLNVAIEIMRKANPSLRFILTVSPVPLTATNSDRHVLIATMESKSILRAVAGQLAGKLKYIDYFPSYEIFNSPCFRGAFFEPNMRSVNKQGVIFVMDSFFSCLADKFGESKKVINAKPLKKVGSGGPFKMVDRSVDQHCEEALLEAFQGQK